MKTAFTRLVIIFVFAWGTLGVAQNLKATSNSDSSQRVRFVTDQQAGTVTITIDEVPAVRIDKAGMQVSGSITYSDEIKDRPFPAGGARGR